MATMQDKLTNVLFIYIYSNPSMQFKDTTS